MQEDNHDGNVQYLDENNEEELNVNEDINSSRYETQLEEALGLHEDDENEYFLYEGEDSNQQPLTAYDEQLRSVLNDANDLEKYSLDEHHSDSAAETFNDDMSPKVRVQIYFTEPLRTCHR